MDRNKTRKQEKNCDTLSLSLEEIVTCIIHRWVLGTTINIEQIYAKSNAFFIGLPKLRLLLSISIQNSKVKATDFEKIVGMCDVYNNCFNV